MLIDNFTEPAKIISYSEAFIFTKKEYDFLKMLGMKECKRIKKEYNLNNLGFTSQKLIENIINNTTYDGFSVLQKEIILSNALLSDDIKIIDTLNNYGFTIEHIKVIIRFRGILKNLIVNNKEIDEELKRQLDIYKRVVTILINIFKDNFYVSNSTIILNKLCQLLVTSPELFETENYHKKLVK